MSEVLTPVSPEPISPSVATAISPSVEAATEQPVRKSADARKEILARLVVAQVAQGARVETQSDYQAVLVRGHRPNNTLHLVLTLVTAGVWGIVWIALALIGGEKRSVGSVDEWGNSSIQRL
jgi:hypothetical protein